MAERDSIDIKRDDVERYQHAASGNSIDPEYFPEWLLAAPGTQFGGKKLSDEFGDV